MGKLEIWMVFNILITKDGDNFPTIMGAFRRPTINFSVYDTMYASILAMTTKTSADSSRLVNRYSGLAHSFNF